ncbi:hypothetical protein CPB84DRAFT_1702355 [Gymnopilus junonius]|uniref:DUF6534 domain-containing protein n=1 Tax=Gymnopilus junonius TaxID=109634 RepID=A0A9P5NW84_GYMJU|nr:hypothetical protein CPB84DRAFT_1702355 [Gymnopilus junonius]
MDSSSLPPLPPDIGRIAGPLVVGYLLHWGLFGVLSMQVYVYYLAFPNDPRGTKALVYGVYAAEVAQTLMLADKAFQTFATGFGNIEAIANGGSLWFSIPIISSVVAFVVQVFYAYRIYVLAKSYIVSALIFLLALFQLGGGIATGIIAHQVTLFTDFLITKTFIATGVWNGGSAACDVVIAAGMTYYLSKRKSAWKPTQRVVQRLIRLIVETGTLTATIAIVNLALSLLPGKPTYYQTTSAILGKVYSTTMMVVFNSRMKIGKNDNNSYDHMSSTQHMNDNPPRRPAIALAHGGVVVTREEYSVPLDEWNSSGKKESGGSRAETPLPRP